MDHPPVDAVAAATRVGLDVAGVDSYSVVGNCLGARTAVLLAETIPGCRGVGLILAGSLKGIGRKRAPGRGAPMFKRAARVVPSLRRMGRLVVQRPTEGAVRLAPEFEALVRATPTLFMFVGTEQMWLRLIGGLSGPIDRAGPGASDRVERVFVPAKGSRGLEPLAGQEAVLRVVPDWVDRVTAPFTSPGSPRPHVVRVLEGL
jgi:pimeloyl-ACP methyl ester carboxylesterase